MTELMNLSKFGRLLDASESGLLSFQYYGPTDTNIEQIRHGIEACTLLETGYNLHKDRLSISFEQVPTWRAFQATAEQLDLGQDEIDQFLAGATEVRSILTRVVEKVPVRAADIAACETFFGEVLERLSRRVTFK